VSHLFDHPGFAATLRWSVQYTGHSTRTTVCSLAVHSELHVMLFKGSAIMLALAGVSYVNGHLILALLRVDLIV
jgi:hypothetical protein